MTFNVHLAQFDTRPRAGISLICDYLLNCKIFDVTLRASYFPYPVLFLIPSFYLSDVPCDPTDLIWKGTPFEAMTVS